MTNPIRFNVYVTVKEGRLEDFKQIAKEWSANNKQERPDILSYEWFFTPDQKSAQVMELYESSDAMLSTLKKVSESESEEEPDYPYEMKKLEVLGNISNELRERLDAGKSPIEYWSHLNGFTR